MRTSDGVEIVDGLAVRDYDREIVIVDLAYREPYAETNQNNGHVEHWFYVRTLSGGHKLMSESRVQTVRPLL